MIEERYAEGHGERLPALADELLRISKVNVMVRSGTAAGQAAKNATTTIPIVSVTSDTWPQASCVLSGIPRGM